MNTLVQKSKLIIALAFLSIIAISCGKKEKEHATASQEKVAAQTAIANLADYPVVHNFSGKLEADKQTNLSTRIMGQIQRIYVKPGQKVNRGDLLIQIRNQDILAKKAQVEANNVEATTAYESAEKDLKRYEALYATNSASDKEMDDMRTRYEMAKARLAAIEQMEKEVEENMRYASIRAPYSGVITTKFIQEGDMANPGMPLLSMESPSQWKVIARIPEADIAKVQMNDVVKVKFTAAEIEMEGKIIEINPSTTNTGNQYMAKVLVTVPENCTAKLYSGMYAEVLFEYGTQKRILVSEDALIHRGQLVGIYAVSQSGNALLRWVKTGKTFGDKVEIISGLTDGEQYVVSSDSKLFDGALIASN
ncbi:efflux RND transporter periplasmic adaptor subunit [Draconibacterium halophilum]|uniref:Efflux RND transporter periplasmic adaptor subunit n=1 Tax=Draconibacterium halophilum TaxID=2706887 RepID=A0A6C0RH19_9BACT|nr:efflux RND transporter periplasmic adaptor subunit [Draconibacterium halophilum]QIA08381.1 efflux RND transporter periplasmic adaptor subunit [Draconibacterium halophilum]